MERKDLMGQIDHFKEEITQLQEQLQETTNMVVQHKCMPVNELDTTDNVKNVTTADVSLLSYKIIQFKF